MHHAIYKKGEYNILWRKRFARDIIVTKRQTQLSGKRLFYIFLISHLLAVMEKHKNERSKGKHIYPFRWNTKKITISMFHTINSRRRASVRLENLKKKINVYFIIKFDFECLNIYYTLYNVGNIRNRREPPQKTDI